MLARSVWEAALSRLPAQCLEGLPESLHSGESAAELLKRSFCVFAIIPRFLPLHAMHEPISFGCDPDEAYRKISSAENIPNAHVTRAFIFSGRR